MTSFEIVKYVLGFTDLVHKNVKYLINNFYIDYMLKELYFGYIS